MSHNDDTPQDDKDHGVTWLAPEATPWKIPMLDVRPVTLQMTSTSKDPQCAQNALSYSFDDGMAFHGANTPTDRRITVSVPYRCDGILANGPLFIPEAMEHKWAIFYHRGEIIFVRGWLREVYAVAEIVQSENMIEVVGIRGVFWNDDETPEFTVRYMDALLRNYALDIVYPVPLPPQMEEAPGSAGIWCMTQFGNRALLATAQPIERKTPNKPLRSISIVHVATSLGDLDALRTLVAEQGHPVSLRERQGLTPLHWAASDETPDTVQCLLELGAEPDVRSDEGATALMNAAQSGRTRTVEVLLEAGADVNATDERGFTAMHRAAEVGFPDVIDALLDAGATPNPEAMGHTPLSLARMQNHQSIVELIEAEMH